jgi:choline-glycine betaine transporter
MTAILNSRITLALVGFVGMAMCSAGIGRVAASGRWADLLSIVGYVLGIAALVVIGVGLLGRSLPYVGTPRQALFVVLGIIVVKVALTALHSGI